MSNKTKNNESEMREQNTAFVGRESELQYLHQAFEAVISNKKPRFILIQGDFGMGKTALVEQFIIEITQEYSNTLVGKGVCATETEMSGLIPFSQVLECIAPPLQHNPEKWREFIFKVAPAWVDIFTGGTVNAIITTIEEGQKLSARSSYKLENIFMQFTNALLQLAKKQPLLVFLDDLQWADASSLDLLTYLIRQLPEQELAILFICTYRPEAMEKEISHHADKFNSLRAISLRYDPKSEIIIGKGIDTAMYLALRYPSNDFPKELVDRIQQMTQGHPLFLNQLCSWWQDTGVIIETLDSQEQSYWKICDDREAELIIPSGIYAVLEQRFNLLSPELHKMAESAAVEGEEFTTQVLIHIGKFDEYTVYDYLEELEDRYRWIHEKETKEMGETVLDIYRFLHRSFRDFIYERLSSGKRRFLHRAVGERLEELYRENLYAIAGQLVVHFQEAHQPKKAARYALMSAQFEQTRYAWKEAEQYCQLGLRLLENIPPDAEFNQLKLDLLDQSGDGYYNSGNCKEAEQQYRMALAFAQETNAKPEQIIELLAELADTCDEAGYYDETRKWIEQGQNLLREHPEIPYSEIHVKLGWIYAVAQGRMGNENYSIQALPNLLAEAAQLPQTRTLQFLVARIYNWLAVALQGAGRYEEAIVNYRKSIDMLEKINEKSAYDVNLAGVYEILGNIEEAFNLVSKALETASVIGEIGGILFSKGRMGRILLRMGRISEAIQVLEEAEAMTRQGGTWWYDSQLYVEMALAYLASGDTEKSLQYSLNGLSKAEKDATPAEISDAHDALGQIEAVRQNWTSANEHFKQSLIRREQVGDHYKSAQTEYLFANALIKQGEIGEAKSHINKALKAFQELKLNHEVAKVEQLQKQVTDN